jgi:hypothetical protein
MHPLHGTLHIQFCPQFWYIASQRVDNPIVLPYHDSSYMNLKKEEEEEKQPSIFLATTS